MTTPSKAAGLAITSASLNELETGNWSVDLVVQTDIELSGQIPLVISGSAFLGTVVRGSVDGASWSGTIEGGLGGIQGDIPARSYSGATVAMILAEIATDSLEAISGEILPSVSATAIKHWNRPAGKASRAIADLASHLDLNWRITREGQIWIGAELYQPVVGLEYKQISQGANDSVTIAPQIPLVSPGDLFLAREVGDVTTVLKPGSLAQVVKFKTDEKTGIATVLSRLFDRMIGKRVDFSASYPARVVIQRPDGTLDVIIDHPRLTGTGSQNVPIRLGIPGASCEIKPGARVRIHFDEQDPSKPFAALWDTNPVDVTVIELGALPQFAAIASLVETAIATAITGHTHSGVTTGMGASGNGILAGSVTPTACTTLKIT